ncbi:hypothetical protein KDA_33240 [Dictyobacter alpinus]|uniref:Uncharacterized protein n=1 Tax=Dictyobacter alpinus TaxID=2014873 RepID=A0A402B952_9CHLR|nr:hypothetical protein [Dictyobacter alpinus]GCE27840.1 hypothetical protein KDA_33240 [Dictyobacter alpinus]
MQRPSSGDARGGEPLDWGIGGCALGISPLARVAGAQPIKQSLTQR